MPPTVKCPSSLLLVFVAYMELEVGFKNTEEKIKSNGDQSQHKVAALIMQPGLTKLSGHICLPPSLVLSWSSIVLWNNIYSKFQMSNHISLKLGTKRILCFSSLPSLYWEIFAV